MRVHLRCTERAEADAERAELTSAGNDMPLMVCSDPVLSVTPKWTMSSLTRYW